MKLLLAILTAVTVHNVLSMEHDIPGPIIRSWLVSVNNTTNKNIKIIAPRGATLEVQAGQTKSGENLLNLDPNQGEKNSSNIIDLDTNATLALLDLNFAVQNVTYKKHGIKSFFAVSAAINKGKSTFYSIMPIATWKNTYSADEFLEGNESWIFEVSIILMGDNLQNSTINVVRAVKQAR